MTDGSVMYHSGAILPGSCFNELCESEPWKNNLYF